MRVVTTLVGRQVHRSGENICIYLLYTMFSTFSSPLGNGLILPRADPAEVTHNEDDILHLYQDLSKSFAISGQKWPDSVLL